MWALTIKELRGFFGNLTGYVVIAAYLLINSCVLWLLPGTFNILEGGYASIDNLFIISPWVFMFLIPALTMRLFSDEKKAGTMELLFTKPITDIQIVWAKYLAGLVLVIFSVLPTLVYYISVYQLGNPVGNIDSGGSLGSYIGLLLLGSSYVALGVFSSSLTDNQIISFLLAVVLCFVFYLGFEQIAGLLPTSGFNLLILNLGINEHYNSLSRGVIDSRDVLYFISLIVLFTLATRLVLQSRKW